MPVAIIPEDQTLPIIFFDGTASEAPILDGMLTDNPTEDGEPVTDHFIKSPLEFTCDVRISATPSKPDLVLKGEGQVLPIQLLYPPIVPPAIMFPAPAPRLPDSVNVLQFPGLPDRIKRTWGQLETLWKGTQVMSLATSRRTYDSMVLTHVEEPISNIYVAKFKLAFRQIKRVQTQTVNAPQPKEPRGVPPTDKGPINPLDDASNQAKSWFKQFTGDKSLLLQGAQGLGLNP